MVKKLILILALLCIPTICFGADKSEFYKDLIVGPFGVTVANGNVLTTGTLGAGAITGTSLTDSGLTINRIPYASTGGLLIDSSLLTFDGTRLSPNYITLSAGTATAGTAPLKFTSGTLNTTAEVGAVEYLTDDFYGTITTDAARKAFVLDDGTRLTATRVPFATTNGRLTDDADMTFATDTLTVTKISGTTQITSPALRLTSSTPTTLSGDVNDWDVGNKSFIRAAGGAADRIVTGILASGVADGHLMIITNIGTTNKISFANESASSTAANRIITSIAGTVEIPPAHTIQLIYDATSARWREMSHL